ncbi:MAG: hypothetical protein KAJ48_02990 [Elusimicrobiales bacterium]|nr:hypothetical protein [Elusimicrobiales bacterium]
MKKIKAFIFNFIAKKYLAGGMAKIYKKFEGNKTQISIGLCVLVGIAQFLGYIPEAIAQELYKIIGTAGTVSLLDKVKRHQDKLEKFEEDIKR